MPIGFHAVSGFSEIVLAQEKVDKETQGDGALKSYDHIR